MAPTTTPLGAFLFALGLAVVVVGIAALAGEFNVAGSGTTPGANGAGAGGAASFVVPPRPEAMCCVKDVDPLKEGVSGGASAAALTSSEEQRIGDACTPMETQCPSVKVGSSWDANALLACFCDGSLNLGTVNNCWAVYADVTKKSVPTLTQGMVDTRCGRGGPSGGPPAAATPEEQRVVNACAPMENQCPSARVGTTWEANALLACLCDGSMILGDINNCFAVYGDVTGRSVPTLTQGMVDDRCGRGGLSGGTIAAIVVGVLILVAFGFSLRSKQPEQKYGLNGGAPARKGGDYI